MKIFTVSFRQRLSKGNVCPNIDIKQSLFSLLRNSSFPFEKFPFALCFDLYCFLLTLIGLFFVAGGVDAGAYKDHGKIETMELCRRICCEMPTCHLAFMLGKTCFSVKCANVDSCRAQPAKPSTYSPKVWCIGLSIESEMLVD